MRRFDNPTRRIHGVPACICGNYTCNPDTCDGRAGEDASWNHGQKSSRGMVSYEKGPPIESRSDCVD